MPAYKMTFDIQIGNNKLNGLEKVEIKRSVDTVIDTAIITLPYFIDAKSVRLDEKVKRGDSVTIKLGYNDDNQVEFEGFVKSVNPNIPLEIECEDFGYKLRKPLADNIYITKTVKDILSDVASQCGLKLDSDFDGLVYNKFVVRRMTAYEVVEKIREEYNLNIYVSGALLIAKGLYTEKNGSVWYDFETNIKSSDLKYVKSEDVKVQVKIKGYDIANKATKDVVVGEKGGDVITLPDKRGVTDINTLTTIAKNKVKELSYDGYRGGIQTWLIPFCGVGYSAKLSDPDNAVRNGTYYVKEVVTTFSRQGGNRNIKLGIKL